MFKKLRNKMLLLNMMTISALIIIAFGVIYGITWSSVNQNINAGLDRSFNMYYSLLTKTSDVTPPLKSEHFPKNTNQPGPKPEFQPSFSLLLDESGNIKKMDTRFSMEETDYTQMKEQVLSHDTVNGKIKNTSGTWVYKYVKLTSGSIITFYETSKEANILVLLIITFILVYIAALAFVFLISLIFANKSIRPIEDAWNRQRQFVADASHELKTPLTTINTNTDVLLSHEDATISEEKKWIMYIKNEAERMSKLTANLLYLARLDHEEGQLPTERICLSDTLEEVLLTMEAVAFEQDISLHYTIDDNVFVKGDCERLKQLTVILLDNAIKYAGRSGTVTVTLSKTKQDACISFSNTGEGILPEDIEHIFDRFYRADKSRARESGGHGLGLAIAKSIVDSHKGSIRVKSAPGIKTEFIVQLPLSL